MRDLQQCRAEIDRLDRQIVALFEERMAVCREVGAYKVAHHLPVLDEERERQVLQAKAELTARSGGERPAAQGAAEPAAAWDGEGKD